MIKRYCGPLILSLVIMREDTIDGEIATFV